MLLINDEKVSQKDLDKFRNWDLKKKRPIDPQNPFFDPQSGAKFNLAAHYTQLPRARKTDGKKTRRVFIPQSFGIDCMFSAEDKKGGNLDVWHYFARKAQRKQRGVVYEEFTPLSVEIRGGVLVVKDVELWWYLVNHPQCAGSPYKPTKKRAQFYFENVYKDTAVFNTKERDNLRAMELLFSDDEAKALDHAGLIELARYNRIAINARMAEPGEEACNELRRQLKPYAERDPVSFIKAIDNPVSRCASFLKEAAEMGVIQINGQSRAVNYIREDGKLGELIHVVKQSTADNFLLLAEYLMKYDTKDHYSKIADIVDKKKLMLSEPVEAE